MNTPTPTVRQDFGLLRAALVETIHNNGIFPPVAVRIMRFLDDCDLANENREDDQDHDGGCAKVGDDRSTGNSSRRCA